MKNEVQEIDQAALNALIARLTEAKQFSLALSSSDIDLLLRALATLSTLQSSLLSNDVTIHKMRKLLGMVVASETLNALLGNAEGDDKNRRDENKSLIKSDPIEKPPRVRIEPKTVHHPFVDVDLQKGSRCPCCTLGTLSKQDPTELLRITGHSPYTAVKHVQERLRCNACGDYFKAPLPEEVLADGGENQKYGYTARSYMALNKYHMGSPFYRQETFQNALGRPIAASTAFDQCEYVANDLHPVVNHLIDLAADAVNFLLDDTPHRILNQKEVVKPQRRTGKPQRRTGTYTSGVIATLKDGHDIVLFQTNIGHAGEWIDEIMKKRDLTLSPPIVMSDALSWNRPSLVPFVQSLCNTHGRRSFVDVLAQFRPEVTQALHLYKTIWVNDKITRKGNLSKEKRLDYHREHSLPIMAEIKGWCEKQLKDKTTEANSGLGKAIQYFLNNYEGLTCFCRVAGAKIDNNKMEAQLKLIVRGRKNFSFYKTLAGAAVSDVITSIIATCVGAGVNPFEYLTAIQRHRDRVKAAPGNWLPWNYHFQL